MFIIFIIEIVLIIFKLFQEKVEGKVVKKRMKAVKAQNPETEMKGIQLCQVMFRD